MIKCWRLNKDNLKIQFRETVLEKVRPMESVQELWEERVTTILKVGQDALSITAGRRCPGDKDTWRWIDKVQEVLKAKKQRGKEDVKSNQIKNELYTRS